MKGDVKVFTEEQEPDLLFPRPSHSIVSVGITDRRFEILSDHTQEVNSRFRQRNLRISPRNNQAHGRILEITLPEWRSDC